MKKLILLLLLVSSAWADTPWRLTQIEWAGATDSVRLNVYADGTLSGTAKKTTVQSWDTMLIAQEGRLNTAVYLIYYRGRTQPAPWVHQRNLKSSATGSFLWYLRGAKFPATVDSAKMYVYRDTVLQGYSARVGGTVSYDDTALTAYAGSYNMANIVLWYQGIDSGAGWLWAWDMTDTSAGVALPGNPAVCRVEGTVLRPDGGKVYGAVITAVRTSGENAASTSNGIGVILAGVPKISITDTAGYFSFDLIGTHEFADTTRGFYDIKGQYKGITLFDLKSIYLPSNSIFNVADTLAARNK